jgi:hypothetical protein
LRGSPVFLVAASSSPHQMSVQIENYNPQPGKAKSGFFAPVTPNQLMEALATQQGPFVVPNCHRSLSLN